MKCMQLLKLNKDFHIFPSNELLSLQQTKNKFAMYLVIFQKSAGFQEFLRNKNFCKYNLKMCDDVIKPVRKPRTEM